jgi:hypothetical protein
MLANRRQAYAERLPQVRAKASEIGLDRMQQGRDQVAGELSQAEAQADGSAFGDAKQRELIARLERVQAMLEQATGSDPEIEKARQRTRLVAGALTWQLAQQHPARVWEAKKTLTTIDAELAEARRRDQALVQAQREEPARHEAFAKRIVELDPRLKVLIPRVASLSKEQQQHVQEIAVAELTRQKERLAVYATQARFAVAQLYDRANVAKDAEHAAKQ